jgi:CRISPR system Cascade subunit CasA
MKTTFDLVESPWISCIQADGTTVELGLRQALAQAHQLRELHGDSPLVTAALYRLLLAVLHRVFGPGSAEEWHALWQGGHWDEEELDAYLERWRHRFDLFDPERPFYQAPDERVKPKSVATLVHEVASGNNPTLFDHHTEGAGLALTPPHASRLLVAAQAFGLAGLSGLPQKFTDAPCARGVIFLVQGESLFETLALNLLPYPARQGLFRHQSDDCPAWENDDPFLPDRGLPRGYLDYLTWQNRRVLLLPEPANGDVAIEQMTVAPALRLDKDVLDPMKHYRQDEKRGPLVLRFFEHRALWRDSAAVLQLREAAYIPPRAFDWLSQLVDKGYLDKSQTRRYLALGMAGHQARVDFYRAERMPLPLAYLREQELVEDLQYAVDMAETAGTQLRRATWTLARLLLSPHSDLGSGREPDPDDMRALTGQWAVDRRYWSCLEIPFRETMEELPQAPDEALEDWRQTLLRTAWQAFDQVADNLGYDPAALKAVVRAGGQLAAGLAKQLPGG